jgi:hypothetical protein
MKEELFPDWVGIKTEKITTVDGADMIEHPYVETDTSLLSTFIIGAFTKSLVENELSIGSAVTIASLVAKETARQRNKLPA